MWEAKRIFQRITFIIMSYTRSVCLRIYLSVINMLVLEMSLIFIMPTQICQYEISASAGLDIEGYELNMFSIA